MDVAHRQVEQRFDVLKASFVTHSNAALGAEQVVALAVDLEVQALSAMLGVAILRNVEVIDIGEGIDVDGV